MRTPRRNPCDEILALIDRCLEDYEARTPVPSTSRHAPRR
jgi:hypothetical protein